MLRLNFSNASPLAARCLSTQAQSILHIPLKAADGHVTSVENEAERKPVVVVLTRHLGCTIARHQLQKLTKFQEELHNREAKLVVVSTADPDATQQTCRDSQLTFTMLSDPDMELYKLLHLRRSFASSMLTFDGVRAAVSAVAAGITPHIGFPLGDPYQNGGTVVLSGGDDPDVLYLHVDQNSGDHATHAEVLAALDCM